VGFTYHGNPTPTVTDDQGNSYSIAASYYDSKDGQSAGIAAAFNVNANARELSLCFSADPGGYVQPTASEFSNVIGIDGNGAGSSGNGSTMQTGALTPSAAGDLLYQVGASLSWAQSGFTAGTQSGVAWNLLSADLMDGWVAQYGIASGSSAITPTIGLGTADNWVSAAALLKTGAAGSVPAGLRVVHLLHENIPYHPQAGGNYMPFPNPVPVQFPCSGNLLVAMIGGGNNPEPATQVRDSSQNPWSQAGNTYSQSDDTVQAFYAANATCNAALSLTTTFSGGTGDYTILFYDVAGAATTPLDTTVGGGGDYGTPGAFTMPFTLTPSTANEIVFAQIMWDYNTGVGLQYAIGTGANSNGLFDANRFSGENLDGPEPVDENNGWGHIHTTTTSPVSFTWQVLQPNSDPIRYWAAMAVAFKAAP